MAAGLRVVLGAGDDPKVYDETGQDVTSRCASITILSHRRAEARLLLHRDGGPYIEGGEVAGETRPVAEIAGAWKAAFRPVAEQEAC